MSSCGFALSNLACLDASRKSCVTRGQTAVHCTDTGLSQEARQRCTALTQACHTVHCHRKFTTKRGNCKRQSCPSAQYDSIQGPGGIDPLIPKTPALDASLLCHFTHRHLLVTSSANPTPGNRRLFLSCPVRCLVTLTIELQGGSNMTGTNCDLFTHK